MHHMSPVGVSLMCLHTDVNKRSPRFKKSLCTGSLFCTKTFKTITWDPHLVFLKICPSKQFDVTTAQTTQQKNRRKKNSKKTKTDSTGCMRSRLLRKKVAGFWFFVILLLLFFLNCTVFLFWRSDTRNIVSDQQSYLCRVSAK